MTPAHLPQLNRLCLTDGGLETDIIFNRGIDLPCFAAIGLLKTEAGRAALDSYYREYLDLAARHGTGFILESPTWRSSPDWAEPLGLTENELDARNREAIWIMQALRTDYASAGIPIVVSGCFGPRGDGYDPGKLMTLDEAHGYHVRQAVAMASAKPDMLTAITMNNLPEAIGIALAARDVGLPVAISFTVETNGRLPTGECLEEAIAQVDQATRDYPIYFMVNCAHPTHFSWVLEAGGAWIHRIRGVRANASRCSHAELDSATQLDIGNPQELGELYRDLRGKMPGLNVLGGCCGTDIRHIARIAAEVAPAPRPEAEQLVA